MTKRKPTKAPGEGARLPCHIDGGDFTLPAALYTDALYFAAQARCHREEPVRDAQWTDRFMRAALYCAFSFFEAQLNQLAFFHAKSHADVLAEAELNVLEEKETTLDEAGFLKRRKRFYPLETRVLFLTMYLSRKEFDRNTDLWSRFKAAKDIRDAWTHPKPPFDTWGLSVDTIDMVIQTLREVLFEVARLMNADPPLWLVVNKPNGPSDAG